MNNWHPISRITAGMSLAVVLSMASWSPLFAQGAPAQDAPRVAGVAEVIGNGKIDWTRQQIRAVGIGLPPEGASEQRGRVLARQAAIAIAKRNLANAVLGVPVSSDMTVNNMALTSEAMKEKVDWFIRGAKILHEKGFIDGSYEVIMGLGLFGDDTSLADIIDFSAVVNAAIPTGNASAKPRPVPQTIRGDYTGLILDCRDLDAEHGMAPSILIEDNETIYSPAGVPPTTLRKQGLVGYAQTMAQAKQLHRIGRHPLVVKAIRMAGKDHQTDPVISEPDAIRVLAENSRSHFLSHMAVVILCK